MKTEIYLLEGMSCDGCRQRIEEELRRIDGVVEIEADLHSAELRLKYEPDKVTIGELSNTIESLGYRLVGQLPISGRSGVDEAVS